MDFSYKDIRSFSVDFAYYIYGNDLGNLSHEKHKQLFDEWIESKLPKIEINCSDLPENCKACGWEKCDYID